MKLKKWKNGFTLAELLVAVAIIAVLVAIAASVFTASMDKAKKAVMNANVRAVKSAAIADILVNESKRELKAPNDGWYVVADISNDGNIEMLMILQSSRSEYDHSVGANPTYIQSVDYITVIMFLTPLEVAAGGSTG